MKSMNISIEKFIEHKEAITLKIVDSTSYSLHAIKEALNLKSDDALDNITFFDFNKNKDVLNLISTFNTYPYSSEFRYVIVSGIKEKDSEIIEQIQEYLLDPMKTTKHIFILENKKIDIECDFEDSEDDSIKGTINFIKNQLKSRSVELKEKNIIKLAEKSKNKLTIISFIEKIQTLNKANSLNQNLVDDLLEDQRSDSFKESYDLMNYINDKNLKACLLEIQKTNFKENIFLEISRITWRFRTYLKIKSLKGASYSSEEIMKSTKVSKYQYKYFDQETNRKNSNEILEGLRALREVDVLLKTTNLDYDNILLNLFKKLCKN
jgi:DNA polymerase III delta subunit